MILSNTVLEADARLIEIQGQPTEGGFVLKRGWPWIAGHSTSGNTIAELLVTLNSTTSYTDPKANNKTYTGKFVVSDNRGFDESQDGIAGRDCQIIQVLAKVKTVTDVASLGTPDKNADRITLNFLGFEEGEQGHIYHKYTHLDPANRDTAMGLSPTESGYTIVKREFVTEKDKTGTLYVVFEYDKWNKDGTTRKWADHKVLLGKDNLSGFRYQEDRTLTGLSKGAQDSSYTAAQTADANRVISGVRRAERANGEYVVQQNQAISYSGTDSASALIIKIRGTLGGTRPAAMVRVWWRRTDTAKEALIVGAAVSDKDSYYHDEVDIFDNGDGTYNVTQSLTTLGTGFSAGSTYFDTNWTVQKTYTRSKDNLKKIVTYKKYVSAKPKESTAWGYIKNKAPTVDGRDHVVKKGPNYYLATAITLTNVANWA